MSGLGTHRGFLCPPIYSIGRQLHSVCPVPSTVLTRRWLGGSRAVEKSGLRLSARLGQEEAVAVADCGQGNHSSLGRGREGLSCPCPHHSQISGQAGFSLPSLHPEQGPLTVESSLCPSPGAILLVLTTWVSPSWVLQTWSSLTG